MHDIASGHDGRTDGTNWQINNDNDECPNGDEACPVGNDSARGNFPCWPCYRAGFYHFPDEEDDDNE